MNNFANTLEKEINSTNTVLTENLAVGYAHTNSKLLDMFYAVGSARNNSAFDNAQLFSNAVSEDINLALKLLLYIRDIREGIGERKYFKDSIIRLIELNSDLANKIIAVIPEFGSWRDIIELVSLIRNDDEIKNREFIYQENYDRSLTFIFNLIKKQLEKDINSKNSISLLAKWMPSINTTSQKSVALAKIFRKKYSDLFSSDKDYRKTLATLRKKLDVVECKMAARDFSEINYSTVPSLANLRYSNAFLKHDTDRRIEFLKKAFSGEANINVKDLMPHEIVYKYLNNVLIENPYMYLSSKNNINKNIKINESLETYWKSLINKTPNFNKNMLVVRDGSGSMFSSLDKSESTRAIDVATALAIMCAEKNQNSEWHNKFITFSSQPKFVTLPGTSLLDNIKISMNEAEMANTNIEKTLDLVLKTVIKNNMKQEEIPDILIISDMEFDEATWQWDNSNRQINLNKSLFDDLRNFWIDAGYDFPKLIFWNVNSRSNAIPLNQNEFGVILMSGFSINLLDMVLSQEIDPVKALMKILNKERYSIVDKMFE